MKYGDPAWSLQAAAEYEAKARRDGQEAHLLATIAKVEQHIAHFQAGGMTRDQAVAMVAFGILVTDIPGLGLHPSTKGKVATAIGRTIAALRSVQQPVHIEGEP